MHTSLACISKRSGVLRRGVQFEGSTGALCIDPDVVSHILSQRWYVSRLGSVDALALGQAKPSAAAIFEDRLVEYRHHI